MRNSSRPALSVMPQREIWTRSDACSRKALRPWARSNRLKPSYRAPRPTCNYSSKSRGTATLVPRLQNSSRRNPKRKQHTMLHRKSCKNPMFALPSTASCIGYQCGKAFMFRLATCCCRRPIFRRFWSVLSWTSPTLGVLLPVKRSRSHGTRFPAVSGTAA